MTERKKMIRGELYDPMKEDIVKEQGRYQDKLWEFNKLKPSDVEGKVKFMKEIFAECGDNCYIELPLWSNWGGHHVHLGNNVYINSNCTLVDDGHIYIGDNVLIGPNVTLATANHPLDAEQRRKALQYNKDIIIEENVWLGANVVVVPGVRIGKNSVIGAGSVVTKDVPEGVLAFGNPCRVIKKIA